jgi:hypothetical protein
MSKKRFNIKPKTRRVLIVCVTVLLLALFSFVAFDLMTVEEMSNIFRAIRSFFSLSGM